MFGKLMQGNPEMAGVILDLLQVYELHDLLFGVALIFIVFKMYHIEHKVTKKRRKTNVTKRKRKTTNTKPDIPSFPKS